MTIDSDGDTLRAALQIGRTTSHTRSFVASNADSAGLLAAEQWATQRAADYGCDFLTIVAGVWPVGTFPRGHVLSIGPI